MSEVAEQLGIGRGAAYRLVEAGQLPIATLPGRAARPLTRVPQRGVDALINRNATPARRLQVVNQSQAR
jgi:excisionase family DNA binding protein